MKAVQVRSITRTYPLRAGRFTWKYLLFEHWSFGTKETHFFFRLSNDFWHKIFTEHNLITWHLICCANWNLLVPWKLLQRLFYCFPAPRLAKVESSQKSNGIYVFRHFSRHICSTIAESIGLTNYAASFDAKKMFRKPKLKMLKWLSIHGTNKLKVRFDSVSLVNNVE